MLRKITVEVTYYEGDYPDVSLGDFARDIWQELTCCWYLPAKIVVSEEGNRVGVACDHEGYRYETLAH